MHDSRFYSMSTNRFIVERVCNINFLFNLNVLSSRTRLLH